MASTISGDPMFWCEYGISQYLFQDFSDRVILFVSDCGCDNPRANSCQGRLTARARAGYNVRFEFIARHRRRAFLVPPARNCGWDCIGRSEESKLWRHRRIPLLRPVWRDFRISFVCCYCNLSGDVYSFVYYELGASWDWTGSCDSSKQVCRQRFLTLGFLITQSDFVSIARFPRKGLWLASHSNVIKTCRWCGSQKSKQSSWLWGLDVTHKLKMIRSDRSRSYSYFKTKFRIFKTWEATDQVFNCNLSHQSRPCKPVSHQASIPHIFRRRHVAIRALIVSAQHQWHQCSWRASRLTASTDSSCFDEAFLCKTRKTKYGSGVTGWLISSLSHR